MAILEGDGAYERFLTHANILIERRRLVSVSDALQLMLDFGSFVAVLISLVVELIKFFDQRKK